MKKILRLSYVYVSSLMLLVASFGFGIQAEVSASNSWTFNYTGTIQNWTVPTTGTYKIEVWGGGAYRGGAYVKGEFDLNKNDTLKMLAGGRGYSYSGAGGTYVAKVTSSSSYRMYSGEYVIPLIVAGGGAGTAGSGTYATSTAGGSGAGGGGGAGFAGDGGNSSAKGGKSFLNGGAYGTGRDGGSRGGFGGGGGEDDDSSADDGGGAGGYQGGNAKINGRGYGGYSYNAGKNKASTSGAGSAYTNGKIVITQLSTTGGSVTTQTWDYNYTGGTQTFTAPFTGTYKLEVWGAEGGGRRLSGNSRSGLGGLGGYAYGEKELTAGQTLHIYVGGAGKSTTSGKAYGGWNGGGSGYASSSSEPGNGGGGATDIRLGGTAYSNRIIVAGGGGGGGEDSSDKYGHGGGLTGSNSYYAGTQSGAGSGGGLGYGGSTNRADGGGGGGGYYGGGTYSSSSIGRDSQGGGGGSSYISGLQNAGTQTGARQGNGTVKITGYKTLPSVVNLSATGGVKQVSLSWTGGDGADSYDVYRNSQVIKNTTSKSFTDTSLLDGTKYTYYVKAKNSSGETKSNTLERWTIPSAPSLSGTNGGLTWSNTEGRGYVNLTWSAVAGATGYKIYVWDGYAYRAFDVGNVTSWDSRTAKIYPSESLLDSKSNDSVSTDILFNKNKTGLDLRDNPNKIYQKTVGETYDNRINYWFRISAYNTSGDSGIDWSKGYFPTLPNRTETTKPSYTSDSISGAYYVDGNNYWIKPNDTVNVKIRGYDADSGIMYSYIRIPAHEDNRAQHSWSSTSTHLNEWDTSTYTDIIGANETYESGAYREVEWTIKGLKSMSLDDIQYYFRDYAGNNLGYVNTGKKIGVDGTAPSKPTLTFSGITQNSITLNWAAFSDSHSGYKKTRIHAQRWNGSSWVNEVNIDGSGGYEYSKDYVDVNKTSHTINGLLSGSKYRFYIRYYDNCDNQGNSGWVEGIWTKPDYPVVTGENGVHTWSNSEGRGYVKLTWPAVTGATGYKLAVFDGQSYRYFDLGNVTSWDSRIHKIFPSESTINSYGTNTRTADIFNYSKTGLDLRDDPRNLYRSASSSTYNNSMCYWFHVFAYNSYGQLPMNWGVNFYNPTLPSSTDKTSPNITVTGNPTSWVVGDVTLSVNAEDNQSGVKSLMDPSGTKYGNINTTLLDYTTWKLGTNGSQGSFSRNGTLSENSIILKQNPWGTNDVVWATTSNDTASNSDGGWNTTNIKIDNTKKYRLSVWIKRENVGNGRTYFGTQGNTVRNLSNNALNSNPYFGYPRISDLPELNNNWLLFVAHIQPHNYSGTSSDIYTGIWDPTTGQKVSSYNLWDYKWDSNATVGGHRTYLYYSTSTNEDQYWYRPRFEVVDGTEPSIFNLLEGKENINVNDYSNIIKDGKLDYTVNKNAIYNFIAEDNVGNVKSLDVTVDKIDLPPTIDNLQMIGEFYTGKDININVTGENINTGKWTLYYTTDVNQPTSDSQWIKSNSFANMSTNDPTKISATITGNDLRNIYLEKNWTYARIKVEVFNGTMRSVYQFTSPQRLTNNTEIFNYIGHKQISNPNSIYYNGYSVQYIAEFDILKPSDIKTMRAVIDYNVFNEEGIKATPTLISFKKDVNGTVTNLQEFTGSQIKKDNGTNSYYVNLDVSKINSIARYYIEHKITLSVEEDYYESQEQITNEIQLQITTPNSDYPDTIKEKAPNRKYDITTNVKRKLKSFE